jgi:hypothetical protein
MVSFARLILCAIVASGTRNARAISSVVRPPTARSVSAIADAVDSAGWQQVKSTSSESSRSPVYSSGADTTCSSAGARLTTSASRRRRADSLRTWSVIFREAT